MDYIFGIVLQLVMVHLLLISYDIACQWFVNIFKRMEEHWPDEIKPTRPIKLIPAIPKLHEPMHGVVGHQVYSLNYIPGVGLSDCECPERVWAPHNALGNSTKTQGPGSRHDVLDDHFGFWNWQKYIGLGATLLRKYKAAVADRNIQAEGHRGLTESLDPDLVERWEKMCVDWEEDNFPKTKKNPYHVDSIGTHIYSSLGLFSHLSSTLRQPFLKPRSRKSSPRRKRSAWRLGVYPYTTQVLLRSLYLGWKSRMHSAYFIGS